MVARQYSNTAVAATVENAGGLANGTTTLVLSSTTGMPAAPFTMRIRPETVNEELITVTGGLGTVGTPYTITRGVDGTSAKSHPQGSPIVHSISARDFKEAQDHIENVTPAGVHGLPASAWQTQLIIAKDVNQGYSNDITANADNELKFTGEANTKYRVEANLMASGDGGDIVLTWTVPTGASGSRMCLGPPLGIANINNTTMRSAVHTLATNVGYGLTSGQTFIQEKSIVTFGSNAGQLVINHRQNVSHATQTIMLAGSYLVVTKLNSVI
jgi:hypothetical protein